MTSCCATMDRRGPFRWGFVLLAVSLVARQTLAGEGVCRTGCQGAAQTFKYAEGTTYKYNYDGKIEISLSSAEGQTTSTEVKATVLLTQLADCNQLLRLQNVQILGSNGKKLGTIPDVQKPIRINFHDGHIEDSICTEPGDTQNSLNIKRAIASIFQANLKDSHETDVFGVCPTEVSQHLDGSVLVVQKTRDLNKCAFRENLGQDFFTPVFNLHSELKSSPFLNGDYDAKLKIKGGILDQANIVENYLFIPFSVGKNGAKAHVTTKLQLAGTSKDSPKLSCSIPKSIIFENPHQVVAPTSNVNVISNAVKEVVKTIDVVVGEKTANEFINLVKTVRAAKKDDLLAVYNQVKSGIGFGDKNIAKKVFLDALLQAATGDTIEVALTLLKNNEFNDIEKKLVYVALSLGRHATVSSLNTAATLLDQKNLPFEAYLGIGNLAGLYCRQHSCEKVDAVNKLSQKLIQKLGEGKTTNKEVENETVFALKALRNFGHLSDSVLQKLIAIAQNKQASNRLRAVALETYLADPCKDKLRNSALTILKDIQQDAEIRIKAYLVLAQCPNAKIGNAVKALLEKEPSYQVGGFIVSHIRTIKSSANPDKENAKQYLGFSVPKRFPIDLRKWSYNGEFSYAIDTLGVAAASETNIIYSQDSWLPRSSSLNLTAEIFGHSLNFLEIQTRQENLDKLVEHYFGPKGVLRTSSLGELLKDNEPVATKLWKHLEEKLSSTLRARRDLTRAEVDSIGKSVQIKENILNKDLDIDISVKAFGSELLFSNINIYQKGLTPEAIIDKVINGLAGGLDKLKNFKETFRYNLLILDTEFDYPTSLGFPLRLATEGTANVQVEAQGSIDIRSLNSGKDNQIHLKLIPSANVEVTGRLTLDALVAENGLKVVSSLYTASGGDVSINLFDGPRGVDIKLGLPVQEQTIISADHEIVFHTREQSGHETNSPLKFAQSKDFSICVDHLSPFIGLVFCGDINGPNLVGKDLPVLPFPLSGDAKVAVKVENEDVSEYHIKRVISRDYTSAEFLVEVIGKNKQPKVNFQVQAEISPEKFIKAVFTSPVKSAYAEARITDNNQEKSLLAKAGYDQTEFYGKIGVSISGAAEKVTYKPILDLKSPGGAQQLPLKVDGQVVVERTPGHSKYTFDNVKVTIPNGKIVNLVGNIGNNEQDYFADLTVSEGKQSANVKGRFHPDPNQLKFNGEFTNTINPLVNFDIKGEVKRQQGQYESSIQLIHGNDLSSKTNKLSITNSLTRKYNNPQDFALGVKGSVNYPLAGLDAKVEFEQTPKSVEYDLDFQYNNIKFGSELEVEINKKQQGDFEVDFNIYGLENKVEFKAERQVKGDESEISNELEVNGKKLEVKGKVKHHIKPANVDVGADLVVVLPTHNTPFKVNSGLQYTASGVDAHHKVTSGSTVIIDAFIKANPKGDANGIFKVNIKELVIVDGQLKATKGSGNADLLIDAPKLKKQVKLESTFQVQPPSVYNIDLTVYPVYGQDKNQKIILSTHNKVSTTNLESRSSANVLGKKLEVNLSGTGSGDRENGKFKGEVEVSLPNDQYLLGKINGDYSHKDDLLNADELISLEYRKNKNTAGRKVSLKAAYKNTNVADGLVDVVYNIAADDSNGNNINADIAVKRSKDGENRNAEYSNKIYGSLLPNPITFIVKSKYNKNQGTGDASASYGPDANLKFGGKYAVGGEGKPCSGDVELQLTTPSKKFKTLKVALGGSVLKPDNPADKLELKASGSVFADDDGSTPDPIVDFNGDGHISANDKEGDIKGNVKYGKSSPVSAALGYSHKETEKEKHLNGNAALQYGQNQNYKVEGSVVKLDANQYKVEVEVVTPHKDFQKSSLTVQTKRSEDRSHTTSVVLLNVDGKVWNLDTELKLSEVSPLYNVKLTFPDGKIAQHYFKANRPSDHELTVEFKSSCEKVSIYLIEGSLDANVENIENFHIKLNLNSPELKINKYVIDIQNKPGKTARKIQVNIKSAGKNLISGSTTYNAREEQGKYIVDGSGTFKVKEESKSANFKYISQRLSLEKNGEEGIEISFDGGLGERALDAEFKLTNKQLRILNSYCEKNKECAHVELDSKTNSIDVRDYDHVLEVTIDLRKLGLSHEFGLKAVTKRQNYLLDHTVDVHFQNQEDSKYQYSLYIHPKEAGVSLTTPKRIISLEGKAEIPQNLKEGGKLAAEVAFYMDKKNSPNKKASVNALLNIDADQKAITGEAKLIHPGLARPLSLTTRQSHTGKPRNGQFLFNVEADVFAQPDQKIVFQYIHKNDLESAKLYSKDDYNLRSPGLGINLQYVSEVIFDKQSYVGEYNNVIKYHVGSSNYDNEFSVKGSKTQSSFILKLLNVDLLKVNNKFNINKEEQTVDSEISSYDNRPLVSHLESKNLNTLLFTIGFKNTPNKKLQFSAGLIPGQLADIRADHITGSGKTNLFHATIKLDDANFLKPEYGVNSKETENVLNIIKNNFKTYVDGLQNIGKEWNNDIRKEASQLGEISKKAAPNLQPLKQYYSDELQKIKEELLQDKSIQEVAELLKSVFGSIAHSVSAIVTQISELVENVVHSIQKAFAGVIDSIDKELVPQLKQVAEKLTAVAVDISKSLVEIFAGYIATISQLIEKYQPEIQQVAAVFGELSQDIARFIQKSYAQIREIITDLSKKIYEELKALPIFDELKAQYEQLLASGLPSRDGIIAGLKEIAATVKDLLPSDFFVQPEIVQIIDLTVQYIEKKLKQEPIDDFAYFDKIVVINTTLIKKIIGLIVTPKYDIPHGSELPVSLDFFKKLPKLVAVKFSPIAYLLNEDPSEAVISFLLSLLNNPRQWFAPFPLYAIIAQGQHIFTFDSKYLTFPGNCKYVLARDAVNGNFTIVGTYANGQLSSISLADTKDSITIKKGGQVLLNNAATELPTRKPDLSAYRDYSVIYLESTAGVKIDCTPELAGCGIHISGFYHAQIKGLLGNGNNEPYDDFTAANGNIVTDEGEFGNSYKVGKCEPVAVPKHDQHQENPECNKLFGWDSPLKYCFPFVKTDNFKLACVHGLAAGIQETELNIAKAYVAACQIHNIPISVPSNLVQCTNSEKAFSVGDKFSVKLPAKAADIILIVETVKSNEPQYKELFQPLVQEIVKTLQSKGISDVQFHLITWGGENKWPSHVTVGGKLTFKGKPPSLKFSEAQNEIDVPDQGVLKQLKPYLEVFHSLLHDVKLAFGTQLQAQTFSEAFFYPFRTNSVKSIIVLNSRACEVGRFYWLQKLRTLLFRNNLISLNLIAPFEDLSVKDSKKSKDVIGFNDEHIFTYSQAKKKPEGTAELYKDLSYNDYCVDFTIRNRGNVFVTNNFIGAKPDAKKQFVHVAAHNIVEELVNVEEGLDCECKLVNPYQAYNICHESYAKEKI